MGNWISWEEDRKMEKAMTNESAYERRRREVQEASDIQEASEIIAKHEYAGQINQVKPPPERTYKDQGITSMLNAVHSAFSSLEDNVSRLENSLTPILSENVPAMDSSDPQPHLESGMAQELWSILRRVQSLDNFVAQIKHRVDF